MSEQTALVSPEHVLLDSSAHSKAAIISEIAALLTSIDPDQAMEVIMERERLGSTGIGHGIAIPHGRLPELNEPVIAIARHAKGVDFDAIDAQPVHIVVLLLAPDNADKAHLELLAHLARILQQERVREAIMQAASPEAVSALFPAPPARAAA